MTLVTLDEAYAIFAANPFASTTYRCPDASNLNPKSKAIEESLSQDAWG
jgi:hypothetical protein